jgi:hypothetical protein
MGFVADKVAVRSFSPNTLVSPVNSETITSSTSSGTGTIGPLVAAVSSGLSHYPTNYKSVLLEPDDSILS